MMMMIIIIDIFILLFCVGDVTHFCTMLNLINSEC